MWAGPQARGLDLDGLRSSHPIEVEIPDSSKVNEIFDAISYAKGACAIHMLVAYLGEAAFRDGMRLCAPSQSDAALAALPCPSLSSPPFLPIPDVSPPGFAPSPASLRAPCVHPAEQVLRCPSSHITAGLAGTKHEPKGVAPTCTGVIRALARALAWE